MNTFIDNKIQSLFDEKANVILPQILNGIDIAELGQLVSNYETEVTGAIHCCSITERCRRDQKTHCFQSGFLYTACNGFTSN
ncbi:MAG: hypothetical protein JNL95_12540 [Chitinophagales bacterium]|nr:hypothetical protein [Chitinophagales bacterium]